MIEPMKTPTNSGSFALSPQLGKGYSVIEKIRLGGTGSTKIIYINGFDFLEDLEYKGNSITYINFELFPKGLVMRANKNSSHLEGIIKKDDIQQIKSSSRKIKIKVNKFHYKIVLDAAIEIELINNQTIKLYCPAISHKSFHSFLKKDWLATKITSTVKADDPILDKGSIIVNFLSSFIN